MAKAITGPLVQNSDTVPLNSIKYNHFLFMTNKATISYLPLKSCNYNVNRKFNDKNYLKQMWLSKRVQQKIKNKNFYIQALST